MPCSGPCQPALSFAQLQQVWTASGGSAAMAPIMAAIALAESGGIPNNTNPTDNHGTQTSWGLWQVSQGNHTPYANWADPTANAKVAQSKLRTQGLAAWGTYTSGAAKTILNANLGDQTAGAVLSAATASGSAGQAVSSAAGVDNEGDIVMPSVIPNIPRRVLRKIVGASVVVAGAVLGLAGVFVLVGGKGKAPGPVRLVQTAIQEKGRTTRAQTREAGLSERQDRRSTVSAERDDLAVRRRARVKAQEESYTSARAAGERAGDEAGPF